MKTLYETQSIRLLSISNNVADLIIDEEEKKVNTLSSSLFLELDNHLNFIQKHKDIKLLRIKSAKKDIFIAGADIKEIATFKEKDEIEKLIKSGLEILLKLQNLHCITLTVINGACLGGGLELALSCDYRIMSSSAKVGFPEVNLGLIPGLGGTQRALALIGLLESLKMITTAKRYDAKNALKLGIIDKSAVDEWLDEETEKYTKALLSQGLKHDRSSNKFFMQQLLKPLILALVKREILKKSKGHYPAPLQALDVLGKSFGKAYDKGIQYESEAFIKLVQTDVSKNLINLFLTSEELKHKVKNAKKIEDVAVIGSGTMGSAIGWLFLYKGFNLRLCTRTLKSTAEAYSKIKSLFKSLRGSKKVPTFEVDRCMDRLSYTQSLDELNKKDFVIEAIPEDMHAKQELFKTVEKNLPTDSIIATNTSSLSLDEMGSVLENPSRLVGMHFFNPVNKMPLVEVIYSDKTSKKSVNRVKNLSIELGKIPILVKDSPGFVINRVLFSYLNEAALLYEDEYCFTAIDEEMKKFGMPMGPFRLFDEVGLDVAKRVSDVLHDAYGDRMKTSQALNMMQSKKWLGKKSSIGFYKYNANKTTPNKELLKSKNVNPEIVERCLLMMINESCMIINEVIIEKASYLDVAMIMGTGFPAFRGGIIKYASTLGSEHIMDRLSYYEQKYGKRFHPAEGIREILKG